MENEKPLTYQKPKTDHPWRQYKDRPKEDVESGIIPLKEFIEDLATNFDKVEVTTFSEVGERRYTLSTVSQKKAAAYICGVLKRNYIQR